jgi:hypothetical protein
MLRVAPRSPGPARYRFLYHPARRLVV